MKMLYTVQQGCCQKKNLNLIVQIMDKQDPVYRMDCTLELSVKDKKETCDPHLVSKQRGNGEGTARRERKGPTWRN